MSAPNAPENNADCFAGEQAAYWKSVARGLSPRALDADASEPDFALDTDGFAMQNGGMFNPMETRMPPGIYYRFFSEYVYTNWGAEGGKTGGWWVDPENYWKIVDRARELDIPLAEAARSLLVIPEKWSDCAYVVRACLTVKLKAYVGKGKPSTPGTSPHNALRDPDENPVQIAPSHLAMKQWYVPGSRDLLGRVFEMQSVLRVVNKGAFL